MEFDVNKIYLDETKDYLINFQKMILNITFDFMSINQQNYDERVNDLLENIGSFFEVDRTYLLAAELGLETIAEGVETEEQKNFLNKYHCDWLQG